MTVLVRPATTADIPDVVALLLADAVSRQTVNANLWRVAPDASARVHASLGTIANKEAAPVPHHWLVAERNGAVVAVAHGVNTPPPPIVDLGGGTAGILMDDSHLPADPDVSVPLLEAAERVMRDSGAVLFVGASPEAWRERTDLFARAGYETTTLYMAKTGLEADRLVGSARPGAPADIAGVTRLSARHRTALKIANPVFWKVHADADMRFAAWMTMSLAMPDRSMFVSGPSGAIDGYVIAQPASPLLVPPAHDAARIGLIDDFYASGLEANDGTAKEVDVARALLGAAEGALHDRGIDTVLAICPARMTAKAAALTSAGYATANLWMVRPA